MEDRATSKATEVDAEQRNVGALSQTGAMPSASTLPSYTGRFPLLGFPCPRPKLYITAEEDDFDGSIVSDWRGEGFEVEYFSMGGSKEEYLEKLRDLSAKELGPCEKFGIIAFGDAAALCLEHYHLVDNNPQFKLGLLVAYYPSSIPDPNARFPSSINTLVHLTTNEEINVKETSKMLGVALTRRNTRKKVGTGFGVGGSLHLAYPTYTYKAEPGFAEHDMEEYDRVSAELAWSRSLAAARRAFGNEMEAENLLETITQRKFLQKDHSGPEDIYTKHKTPHVTNVPTMTGGTGTEELQTFYRDFFQNSPSLKVSLLSRTIGSDRAVDEMYVRFRHTRMTPWILPGVPPTNKKVEIVMVSIVTMRGSKLYHEHVYWDQASVLVQVGLLDPTLVPKGSGIQRLPVVGKEATKRMIKNCDWDEGGAHNELILGDYSDTK